MDFISIIKAVAQVVGSVFLLGHSIGAWRQMKMLKGDVQEYIKALK